MRSGAGVAALVSSFLLVAAGLWEGRDEILAQTSQPLRSSRAVLDAAGGPTAGPRGIRMLSSSSGSWIQTGKAAARFSLRGGFVQPLVPAPARVALLPGDFNQDRSVDFSDFFLFAEAFGSRDARFDLTRDGRVDFEDFFLFAVQFGRRA